MPQPLSKLAPKAIPNFTYNAIEQLPGFAPILARTVSMWAWLEFLQDHLIISLMGGSSEVSVAMFNRLDSDRVKLDILSTAAQTALRGLEYQAFEAAIATVRPIRKQRNKIVHRLWGICDDLPNHLLLINPLDLGMQREHGLRIVHTSITQKPPPADSVNHIAKGLDKSRILCYTVSDLERLCLEINKTIKILEALGGFLTLRNISPPHSIPKSVRHKTPGTASFALRQLCKLDLFQKARFQLREARRKQMQSPDG